MIYLDSDVAIDWMHGAIKREIILGKLGQEDKLAITAPSLYEIYQGLYILQWDKKRKKGGALIERERTAIEKLRHSLIEVPWDGNAAQKSAEIYHMLAAKGEGLDVFDTMIAGTIIAHGEGTLITRNARHFDRIPDLHILSV